MHFPTNVGLPDDSAFFESRILYPKRNSQCLQFFYKMTGSPKDRLLVWARREDPVGKTISTTAAATFIGEKRRLETDLLFLSDCYMIYVAFCLAF